MKNLQKLEPYLKRLRAINISGYRLIDLLAIFLVTSVVGWLWEVFLFLGSGFVNRGSLHGPWLPIYGAASVFIVILVRRHQKSALICLESAGIVGLTEYFTSLFTEKVLGHIWWDYSGERLNIQGRVCAKDLLFFGFAGFMLVTIIAPWLRKLVERHNSNKLLMLELFIFVIFAIDFIYSWNHPNTGAGVSYDFGQLLMPFLRL